MKLKSSRVRGPEGFRNYEKFEITYASGDTVERFHPGTQYHHKKGYFKARDCMFGTGHVVLTCVKPVSWEFTIVQCPNCFDRMCSGHIKRGYCNKQRIQS